MVESIEQRRAALTARYPTWSPTTLDGFLDRCAGELGHRPLVVTDDRFSSIVAAVRLGRRIFEVIAPELADRYDGRVLAAEEARALARTTFTMWEDDEGTTHGRFRVPARQGRCCAR